MLECNVSASGTFVRFALVWFCLFPLPFGVWDGLRLVIVALPGLFSYLFVIVLQVSILVVFSLFSYYSESINIQFNGLLTDRQDNDPT